MAYPLPSQAILPMCKYTQRQGQKPEDRDGELERDRERERQRDATEC